MLKRLSLLGSLTFSLSMLVNSAGVPPPLELKKVSAIKVLSDGNIIVGSDRGLKISLVI